MQKLRTNFKFVFDILVGTVFIYMTGTSIQQTLRMTGTSIQRILRMPTKSDSVVRVEGTQQPAGKSVLTDEDIDNIQQGIKPVQFKDEEHHHGKAN